MFVHLKAKCSVGSIILATPHILTSFNTLTLPGYHKLKRSREDRPLSRYPDKILYFLGSGFILAPPSCSPLNVSIHMEESLTDLVIPYIPTESLFSQSFRRALRQSRIIEIRNTPRGPPTHPHLPYQLYRTGVTAIPD